MFRNVIQNKMVSEISPQYSFRNAESQWVQTGLKRDSECCMKIRSGGEQRDTLLSWNFSTFHQQTVFCQKYESCSKHNTKLLTFRRKSEMMGTKPLSLPAAVCNEQLTKYAIILFMLQLNSELESKQLCLPCLKYFGKLQIIVLHHGMQCEYWL